MSSLASRGGSSQVAVAVEVVMRHFPHLFELVWKRDWISMEGEVVVAARDGVHVKVSFHQVGDGACWYS